MEEKSQKPSAKDQKESQKKENFDDKSKAVKETASDGAETKVIKKALDEVIKINKDTAKETKVSSEENHKKSNAVKIKEASTLKKVDYSKFNIEELIESFREITTEEQWLKNHLQIQTINHLFEEKFHDDVKANKKDFINNGGNEIDFLYRPKYKEEFDQLDFEYRKKRRTHFKDQEAVYKVNLELKKTIIEEIKGLIGADQNINTIYKSFRTLQEGWYSTGPVSRSENQNIWETFKHHVERFYDFLHLNRELRDLDYKHNYEEKLKIIERAEILKDLSDVMRASRDLNTLHQLWKNDLGPVAREHREALWNRFKEVTKIIQSRRQEYQKGIAGVMKGNLEKKKILLKEMEHLTVNEPQNHNAWQNALVKFNELRKNFKNIGYVPSKESKVTWQEFREIGRNFMQKKNIFYKKQKQEYNQNIEAKKGLISKSQNLLKDVEWDSKVLEMKSIQKEWKNIGFIPRKLDNKLWSDFSEVHKTFFDRIKSGYQHLTPEQEALQNQKITAIEVLNNTKFSQDPKKLLVELTESYENWNAIPKIGGQTESELIKKFNTSLPELVRKGKLDKKAQKEVLLKLDFILLQNDPDKLQKKISDVGSTLIKLKTELTQLENNLEFFSHSSSENPLFKNVEKQIKSCQIKINKTQVEYIRLKQIKNTQIKLANQEADKQAIGGEENQESD
jgi:hypothetical protein